jgi:hypothetical protein
MAGREFGDLGPEGDELLKTIASGNELSSDQATKAKSLSKEADDRYFSFREQDAPEAEWLAWFSKARLFMAIGNGLGGSAWHDAADAIYELTKTQDDAK